MPGARRHREQNTGDQQHRQQNRQDPQKKFFPADFMLCFHHKNSFLKRLQLTAGQARRKRQPPAAAYCRDKQDKAFPTGQVPSEPAECTAKPASSLLSDRKRALPVRAPRCSSFQLFFPYSAPRFLHFRPDHLTRRFYCITKKTVLQPDFPPKKTIRKNQVLNSSSERKSRILRLPEERFTVSTERLFFAIIMTT